MRGVAWRSAHMSIDAFPFQTNPRSAPPCPAPPPVSLLRHCHTHEAEQNFTPFSPFCIGDAPAGAGSLEMRVSCEFRREGQVHTVNSYNWSFFSLKLDVEVCILDLEVFHILGERISRIFSTRENFCD